MIIDVHSHRFMPVGDGFFAKAGYFQPVPPDGAKLVLKGITIIACKDMTSPERQREVYADAGVDLQMISDPAFIFMLRKFAGMRSLDIAKQCNDQLAEWSQNDSVVCMAAVDPFDEAHVAELERGVEKLGLRGVCVQTSYDQLYLDSPLTYPLYEYLEDKKIPLFVHPPLLPRGYEVLDAYRLEEVVGRPYDTSITILRMIYSGVFDRFPNLQVFVPHMGACLLAVMGRADMGMRLGYEGMPAYAHAKCERKPSEYIRTNLYTDTMGFWPSMVEHVVKVFGVDRMLFGTDYPAVPISPREHIDIVKGLDISDEDKEKIFSKNAVKLFNLSV